MGRVLVSKKMKIIQLNLETKTLLIDDDSITLDSRLYGADLSIGKLSMGDQDSDSLNILQLVLRYEIKEGEEFEDPDNYVTRDQLEIGCLLERHDLLCTEFELVQDTKIVKVKSGISDGEDEAYISLYGFMRVNISA